MRLVRRLRVWSISLVSAIARACGRPVVLRAGGAFRITTTRDWSFVVVRGVGKDAIWSGKFPDTGRPYPGI